tara:strand:+ start:249 stop:764 length:516 start_codon:yes stop_codon:yes gene_type:complete
LNRPLVLNDFKKDSPHPREILFLWNWVGNTLSVQFEVKPSSGINWPQQGENSRKYELWKTTCFEFFLSEKNSNSYLEFNLSPSGAWDAYQFSSYREPNPPQRFEEVELVRFSQTDKTVSADFKFKKDFSTELEANITAVIEDRDGTHYFACHHAKDKPDFHDRKSICIKFN